MKTEPTAGRESLFDHGRNVTQAEVAEAIADLLANASEGSKAVVVGPIDDGTAVVILQPLGDHLMIVVNRAEMVLR